MRPEKKLSFNSGKLSALAHNPVVHLFEQPGYRGKQVWFYLFQIIADRFEAFCIIDRNTFVQVEIGDHPLENVIQRQKA